MKKSLFAIIGAIVASIASSMCCLPAVLFLVFGISSSFLSYLASLWVVRVPLVIVSIVLFCLWIYYRYKECNSCSIDRKKTIIYAIILFLVILFVISYPEVLPLFME